MNTSPRLPLGLVTSIFLSLAAGIVSAQIGPMVLGDGRPEYEASMWSESPATEDVDLDGNGLLEVKLITDSDSNIVFSAAWGFTGDYPGRNNGLNALNGSLIFIEGEQAAEYAQLKSSVSTVMSALGSIYDGAQELITSFAVYKGKFYAGQGGGTAGDGDVLVFDGSTWNVSCNGAQEYLYCLAVYNGKLYAGQGADTGDGDVLVFDGSTWSVSYNGAQEEFPSFAVYNGKLYAGQGSSTGDGDVLVFDGFTW